MAHYRAHILDEEGLVIESTSIFADDDDDARGKAKNLRPGRCVEIWQGTRKIALIETGARED